MTAACNDDDDIVGIVITTLMSSTVLQAAVDIIDRVPFSQSSIILCHDPLTRKYFATLPTINGIIICLQKCYKHTSAYHCILITVEEIKWTESQQKVIFITATENI